VETLELSKYFQSVRLEVGDDPNNPNAKIVTFRLIERPMIYSIEYSGLGSISPSDIADRFKRRDVDLAVGGFFNPTALLGAQAVIRDVLAHHSHPAAQVKVSFESVPVSAENAVDLTFTVTEGPANSR
jgi:outer membrane protein assembly factor BamA